MTKHNRVQFKATPKGELVIFQGRYRVGVITKNEFGYYITQDTEKHWSIGPLSSEYYAKSLAERFWS